MLQSAMTRAAHRRVILPSMIFLAAAIGFVAWLAPAEKTLGEAVKFVYVHGAVIRVTLLAFVVSAGLGLIFLITRRVACSDWSQTVARTALVMWLAYVATSYVATMLTWGGIPSFEPRWIFTFQVLVLAPVFHLVGVWLKDRRIAALLNVALAALVLWLLSQAQLVLHPLDPIGTATTPAIRDFYAVLLVLCALFAAQLARGIHALGVRARLVTSG